MQTITIEQMRGLVERGLVREKVDSLGYSTFKYHNKVFYNNLWHVDEALLEARGIVFDPDGEIAQRPFKKIFNRGENGTDFDSISTDDVKHYTVARKVNGFMAAASFHKGRFLVSTTGTTTSEYADLAKSVLWGIREGISTLPDFTFIFEIVDESDPHIVPEDAGAYLLGIRHKQGGFLVHPKAVMRFAVDHGWRTPELKSMTAANILDEAALCQHEGFVVYDDENPVLKLKSPHYLSKKALMRMGRKNVNIMFDNPEEFRRRLDEEFYDLFDHIQGRETKSTWIAMTEADRREYIEEYFSG